jgi:small subunit ribosomal protein S21
MQLLARNNDPPLGVVTKKIQREGLFREIKERRACKKPSERRVREKGTGDQPPLQGHASCSAEDRPPRRCE